MSDAIRRLRELEQAATPAPWKYEDDNDYGRFLNWPDDDENDALIVAARNALPLLLNIAEALNQIVTVRDEYDAAFQRRDWDTCERIEYESDQDDPLQQAKAHLAAFDAAFADTDKGDV